MRRPATSLTAAALGAAAIAATYRAARALAAAVVNTDKRVDELLIRTTSHKHDVSGIYRHVAGADLTRDLNRWGKQ